MLGRLSWAAIPFNEPLPLLSGAVVGIVILAVLVAVTVKGWWPYLWREWLTSVDHKRIGVMYVTLGLVMLLRGFSDAIMMRTQQAIAIGSAQGYLPPEHYNQVFSAHGTIMIFFVAMPLVIGLMNFVVPLQLGVRDVAFPVLNSVSLWLTATGALLINLSLVIGNFARTGWMGYPPLSGIAFSPDVGVDYYLWSLQISGIGTLLTGVNFVTTILKLRAPGMTYMRMPIFCWTALASSRCGGVRVSTRHAPSTPTRGTSSSRPGGGPEDGPREARHQRGGALKLAPDAQHRLTASNWSSHFSMPATKSAAVCLRARAAPASIKR